MIILLNTYDLLDTVIDRFGENEVLYSMTDKNHFSISTKVEISKQFYSWVCGFGKKAVIKSPPDVVEDFKSFLLDINQMYEY